MNPATQVFSHSYAQAREKFVQAAEDCGLYAEPHLHPLRGSESEELALDVVRDGPPGAERLLIISSACHGIEGFCGSGVQVALLRDAAWQAAAHDAGVAVLYLHGLNPYGFSWLRRVTQENVDLNRNFVDFQQPLPVNAAYDELAHLLVPHSWPPSAEVAAQLQHYIATHGERALQQAVSSGQYAHPEGLFYGGINPTWSNVTLRHVLQEHGHGVRRLGWIDLHTGLGPTGHGERIFAGRDDAQALGRARAWWGPEVTSTDDGSSSSPPLSGQMWSAAYDELPEAEFTGIALEFGTVPLAQVLDALRADQWLENHPEAGAGQAERIKLQMRQAFFVDTEAWKMQVLEQAQEAAHQGIYGLRG